MAVLCLFLDHEMILCKVESENGAGSLYVNAALHYFRKCTGPCQLHRRNFQINAKRLKIQRYKVRTYRQVKNGWLSLYFVRKICHKIKSNWGNWVKGILQICLFSHRQSWQLNCSPHEMHMFSSKMVYVGGKYVHFSIFFYKKIYNVSIQT